MKDSEMHQRVTGVIRSGFALDIQPDIIAYKAIEVMREPTDEMLIAGVRVLDENHASQTLAPTWTAMINAALK